MTKHLTTPITPPIIDDERFSSNGMIPSSALARRLANCFNYISGRAKKFHFCRAQNLGNMITGPSSAEIIWPAYIRTGENTTAIRVVAGMTVSDIVVLTNPTPEFHISVTTSAGAAVTSKSWYHNAIAGGVDVAPNEIHHIHDVITGLTANTEYRLEPSVTEGARMAYLSISDAEAVHADDTVTAVCDPGNFLPEAPIYDGQIADLVEANNLLWRHNGSALIGWACDYDTNSTPPPVTATSYTNVIDGASTTVTASSEGFNLFTQYHNTANRTTIPVKMAVRVDRTAGAGSLDIRLTDGTNSITITTITTALWTTATTTIPVQAGTKWDIQAKVSAGGTTFDILAVDLWEWET